MKNIYSKFILYAVFVLCIFSYEASQAQNVFRNSNGKEVAYSFYKTAGSAPNFERWIKKTDPYLSTPLARSESVIKEEKSRLRGEFNAFDPDQYPIRLKLKTRLSLEQKEGIDENVVDLHLNLADEYNKQDMLFFPFTYIDDNFAVIIEEFEKWETIVIPLERYAYLQGHLNINHDTEIRIELIPTSADIDMPLDIEGIPHWLMSAKIGSFVIYSTNGTQLYAYTAPWYLSPVQAEITELKSIQEEIAKDLNIELPPILMPIPTKN